MIIKASVITASLRERDFMVRFFNFSFPKKFSEIAVLSFFGGKTRYRIKRVWGIVGAKWFLGFMSFEQNKSEETTGE